MLLGYRPIEWPLKVRVGLSSEIKPSSLSGRRIGASVQALDRISKWRSQELWYVYRSGLLLETFNRADRHQTITDLDDFLTPSQACIIPVRQTNKVAGQETGVNGDVSACTLNDVRVS